MKAVICTAYGAPEILKIKDIKKPTPKDNEVLIKMRATTATSGDARMRSFNVPPIFWLPFRLFIGFTKPKHGILGFDVAGKIEAVGKDVKRFKKGDTVFGSSQPFKTTYAEYVCLPANSVLAKKPTNITFEQAGAVFFGAHTAYHFLRLGKIKKGQKVMIYGASGALGTYAVQLAKHLGAEVSGVCGPKNLKLIKSLGASKVYDYTKEDFTKNSERYDVIFDTVGKSNFKGCVKSLKRNGIYLRAVHLTLPSILKGIWVNMTTNKKVIGGVAGENLKDLMFLKGLLEKKKLKPVIDKTFPLDKIVEAHRYVDTGHKVGNVVIKIPV